MQGVTFFSILLLVAIGIVVIVFALDRSDDPPSPHSPTKKQQQAQKSRRPTTAPASINSPPPPPPPKPDHGDAFFRHDDAAHDSNFFVNATLGTAVMRFGTENFRKRYWRRQIEYDSSTNVSSRIRDALMEFGVELRGRNEEAKEEQIDRMHRYLQSASSSFSKQNTYSSSTSGLWSPSPNLFEQLLRAIGEKNDLVHFFRWKKKHKLRHEQHPQEKLERRERVMCLFDGAPQKLEFDARRNVFVDEEFCLFRVYHHDDEADAAKTTEVPVEMQYSGKKSKNKKKPAVLQREKDIAAQNSHIVIVPKLSEISRNFVMTIFAAAIGGAAFALVIVRVLQRHQK